MSFGVTPTHFPGWKEAAASMQTLLESTQVTEEPLRLCLHLAMGLYTRCEQRNKLITLCTALLPDITFAAQRQMTPPPPPSSLAHLNTDLLLRLLLLKDIYISLVLKCWATMDDLSHSEWQPNLPDLSFPGSQERIGAVRPAFNVEHRHQPQLSLQFSHLLWQQKHSIFADDCQSLALALHMHTIHSYLNIMHKKGWFTIIGVRKPEYTREHFKWGSYPKPPWFSSLKS